MPGIKLLARTKKRLTGWTVGLLVTSRSCTSRTGFHCTVEFLGCQAALHTLCLFPRRFSSVTPEMQSLLLFAWRRAWAYDLGLYESAPQCEGGKGRVCTTGGETEEQIEQAASSGVGPLCCPPCDRWSKPSLEAEAPGAAGRAGHIACCWGRVVGGKGRALRLLSSTWLRASVITPGLFFLLFRDA